MKFLATDNMTNAKWIEWKKKKEVVMQDLRDIKRALKVVNSGGDVIDKTWKD